MGQSSEGPTPGLTASVDAPPPSGWIRDMWALILALAVTTVTCLASGTLKTMAGEVAPIWLTNAVLLAQMMVAPPRQRYWVLGGGVLGNLAANLWVGESLGVSVAYSSADILEVWVAFLFAPRISTVAELIRPRTLIRFLTGGVLLAPIASGLIATTLLAGQLSGYLLSNLANWFVSDALSLAIFTPAAVVLWSGEVTHLLRADRRRRTAFLLLLVCVVTAGVFGQSRFELLYWQETKR